jgi:hypothetical protein
VPLLLLLLLLGWQGRMMGWGWGMAVECTGSMRSGPLGVCTGCAAGPQSTREQVRQREVCVCVGEGGGVHIYGCLCSIHSLVRASHCGCSTSTGACLATQGTSGSQKACAFVSQGLGFETNTLMLFAHSSSCICPQAGLGLGTLAGPVAMSQPGHSDAPTAALCLSLLPCCALLNRQAALCSLAGASPATKGTQHVTSSI